MNVTDCFEISHAKNVAVHTHERWEIVVYISGSAQSIINDTAYCAEKGCIAVIPPNTPHSETTASPYSDICITANHLPFYENEVIFIKDSTENVITLAKMLRHSMIEKSSNYEKIADTLLSAVFEYILQLSETTTAPALIRSIKHYLAENLSDPSVNMDLLCAKFGFNRDYLRRVFKEYTGRTPLEYLNFLRMTHAKELLSSKVYRIKEIAMFCGFEDAYYFSRAFRKFIGVSPYEFRKNLN